MSTHVAGFEGFHYDTVIEEMDRWAHKQNRPTFKVLSVIHHVYYKEDEYNFPTHYITVIYVS